LLEEGNINTSLVFKVHQDLLDDHQQLIACSFLFPGFQFIKAGQFCNNIQGTLSPDNRKQSSQRFLHRLSFLHKLLNLLPVRIDINFLALQVKVQIKTSYLHHKLYRSSAPKLQQSACTGSDPLILPPMFETHYHSIHSFTFEGCPTLSFVVPWSSTKFTSTYASAPSVSLVTIGSIMTTGFP